MDGPSAGTTIEWPVDPPSEFRLPLMRRPSADATKGVVEPSTVVYYRQPIAFAHRLYNLFCGVYALQREAYTSLEQLPHPFNGLMD